MYKYITGRERERERDRDRERERENVGSNVATIAIVGIRL
jgi:hypothetical protein